MTNIEARSSNGNLMIQNEYEYDMIGNILKLTNSAGANNGIGGTSTQKFEYDKLNRINTANGSWTNNTNTYTYDLDMTYAADGKIMYKEQIHELNGNAIQNSTYLHDYQYSAAYKPHAPTQVGSTDYFYDLNGNLSISEDNRNQLIRYFSWDEENRLKMVSDKRSLNYYLYDAGGERTLKIIAPYSQMDVNRDIIWQGFMSDRQTLYVNPFMVVNEKGYTKHYYADNQRIVSKIGGGFLYNPVNVYSQVYGINCLTTNDYAHKRENDEAMLQRDIDAQWPGCSLHFSRRLLTVIDNEVNRNATENLIYYYHPDHLGSSNTLTDITGLPFQHLEYMPFGETFVEENIGSYSTPYRFTSKELDDETGLYYYGARYYDPKLSMFLGVDPLSSSFPALSGYAYCYNNPTNFTDRWGLFGSRKEARKFKKENGIKGTISFDEESKSYVIHNKKTSTSYYKANNDFDKSLLGYNKSTGVVTSSAPNTNANFQTYSTGFKYLWKNKFIFPNIPDNFSLDLTLASTFGRGASMCYTINFLTRGDVGFVLTRTEQERTGFGIDWGLGLNFGYYLNNPLQISGSSLLGPTKSISFFSTSASQGYDNNSNPNWVGIGSGIGFSFGLTKGKGKTLKGWN